MKRPLQRRPNFVRGPSSNPSEKAEGSQPKYQDGATSSVRNPDSGPAGERTPSMADEWVGFERELEELAQRLEQMLKED